MSDNITAHDAGQQTDRTRTDADEGGPPVPGLAYFPDGRILISTAYLQGADLKGRERWEGVFADDAEAENARKRLQDAADDAAAHLGGQIISGKKTDEESKGLVSFPEFGIFMMVKADELPKGVDPDRLPHVKDGTLLCCPIGLDGKPELERLGAFEVICDHVCRAANKAFGTSFRPEDFPEGLAGENVTGGPCECSEEARAKHGEE